MSNTWYKPEKHQTFEQLEVEIIDGDRGINYPKEKELNAEGYCLFLSAKNVTKKGFRFKDNLFINEEKDKLLRNGKLSRNDIVLTTRGTVGNVGFFDESISYENLRINSGMVILRIDRHKINQEFLYHLLKSEIFQIQLDNFVFGSAQPQLTVKVINKFKFPKPEKSTQTKIAQILTTLDHIIEKTEAAIAKYEAIKEGMMHDLFTRGIGADGQLRPSFEEAPELYEESGLGWIPKGWRVESIEDVTDYVDYRGKTPPKTNSGIFLVTAKNVKFGYIDYECSKEYIPQSAYKSTMSRGEPKIGDVLITTEAPMGNVAQINVEGIALAQRVIKYRATDADLTNDFLKNVFLSDYFQRLLYSQSTGSTVVGIKGSKLHKLKIFIPLKGEQLLINDKLNEIEKLIDTEKQFLSKQTQLKQGLMQDLLTGKVAVNA